MPRTGSDTRDLAELYESLMWILPAINPGIGTIEPPARYKRTGLIAYADGVNWNPNSQGAGNYRYDGAAWVKHLEPDDTFTTSINADKTDGFDATATPTANRIVVSLGGSQYIDKGWLPRPYESTQQTITSAGALTLAHGLGVKPQLIQVSIVCQTAEGGYSIGDEVFMNPHVNKTSTNDQGVSIVPDSTNLNIRYGAFANAFSGLRKDTGVTFGFTNANWNAVFRAWAW